MKLSTACVVVALCAPAAVGLAQAPVPAPQAAPTDVYNVMFVKAAPGQAAALAKQLQQPTPTNPESHSLLLRHQEGADWDYCLIYHVGPRGTVEITPPPAGSDAPTRAWHEDTFVAGPPWPEFQRLMGLTGEPSANAVYVVGVHRPVPGHRADLLQALSRPAADSKVPINSVLMVHLEGGPWQFLSIDRYDSWQDLGTARAATATGQGWLDIRQHSAFHTDTIADRVR